MPTHVPIGSMRGSFDCTAIFAREPGSRAAALISSRPSSSSGTSSSKSFTMNSGADARQDELRAARGAVDFPDVARARGRRRAGFPSGSSGRAAARASSRPDSISALPRSMRLMTPVTSDSLRARKSFRICSRSASRIFCRITCFAVCAPMRPNFEPRAAPRGSRPAGSRGSPPALRAACIWCEGASNSSSGTTCQRRKNEKSPRRAVDVGAHVDVFL